MTTPGERAARAVEMERIGHNADGIPKAPAHSTQEAAVRRKMLHFAHGVSPLCEERVARLMDLLCVRYGTECWMVALERHWLTIEEHAR